MDDPGRVLVVRVAERPKHHRTETERTDLHAGTPENAISHALDTTRWGELVTWPASLVDHLLNAFPRSPRGWTEDDSQMILARMATATAWGRLRTFS